jgi:hypothetical protein
LSIALILYVIQRIQESISPPCSILVANQNSSISSRRRIMALVDAKNYLDDISGVPQYHSRQRSKVTVKVFFRAKD